MFLLATAAALGVSLAVDAPAGVAQQGANPRFGLVNASADPQAAQESGAGWEIVTLRWDELQPDGPTDWNPAPATDEWLASTRVVGREVAAVVIGTPSWATGGGTGTGVPRGLYLPVNDPGNAWAGFIGRAASYYGAKGVNRWIIWRDPDIPASSQDVTWEGSIEEYYQMVKVAYLTVKQANPNASIHLGGVGGHDPNWFNRFLDITLDDPTAPANNYYFDVATLHVYDSPERAYTLMRNHFFVMEQKGIPLKEVWLNETNTRPAIDPQVYPPDITFRERPNTTQEQQAAYIVQTYALTFAANRGARIAVYQLVDNLDADGQQAYGLVRADGSRRPAYRAYQLIAEELNGFVFARRVEDGTAPLVDYVRFTFNSKVTHVVWALTEQTATLIIPARTSEATLLDLSGNRWSVRPEGGFYRVVVEGAECNDPVEGCVIGGSPWLLVEDGISDASNQEPPPVSAEIGGTLPTPDPGAAATATARAAPTSTEIPTLAPSDTAIPQPTDTPELTSTTSAVEITETPPSTEAPTREPGPTPRPTANPEAVRPRGLQSILPYILIGAGVLSIGSGMWYFAAGRLRTRPQPAAEAIPDTPDELAVAPHAEDENPEQDEQQPPPPRRRRRKKPADSSLREDPEE